MLQLHIFPAEILTLDWVQLTFDLCFFEESFVENAIKRNIVGAYNLRSQRIIF